MANRKLEPIGYRSLRAGDVLCAGKWGDRAFFVVDEVQPKSFSMRALQWSPDAVREPGVLIRVLGAKTLRVRFSKNGASHLKRSLEFYREPCTVKGLSSC